MSAAPEAGMWERFIETFFRPDLIDQYAGAIGKGVIVTCEIAVLVVICGLSLGMLLAIVRAYRIRALSLIIVGLVDLLRSLPWLVLTLVLAAFAEEIFWAGILSVRKGQWEAARSTGLGFNQCLIYVVVPQAIRMTVAPLTNRTIAITKNTALGTVIGVGEILNEASTAQSFSGSATPLMMGAIAYILLFIPVVIVGRWIETRFQWRRA